MSSIPLQSHRWTALPWPVLNSGICHLHSTTHFALPEAVEFRHKLHSIVELVHGQQYTRSLLPMRMSMSQAYLVVRALCSLLTKNSCLPFLDSFTRPEGGESTLGVESRYSCPIAQRTQIEMRHICETPFWDIAVAFVNGTVLHRFSSISVSYLSQAHSGGFRYLAVKFLPLARKSSQVLSSPLSSHRTVHSARGDSGACYSTVSSSKSSNCLNVNSAFGGLL